MFYDKKIKYLDYYERGERIKGCGFAKIEARDEELRIELTVSGLYPTDSFAREVMLCGEKQEKQLTQIEMYQGRGELKRIYHSRNDIGGTGIPYWELCGICIHLGGEREISCRWQKNENKPAEMHFQREAERSLQATAASMAPPMSVLTAEQDDRSESTSGNRSVELAWTERERTGEDRTAARGLEKEGVDELRKIAVGENAVRRGEARREEARREETRRGEARREEARREETRRGEIRQEEVKGGEVRREEVREETEKKRTTGQALTRREVEGGEEAGRGMESQPAIRRETTAREPSREERRHPRMLDDKWMQLCAIYPHVQPFRDERDYLSIKPADFLLFPANAYRQVNNSFLLHGFYNYKHLLLTRVERKGEILYYIGVPGNYYEKEKQVALMFGFESFECAEEPAEDGDFGYYMMRMEL